MTGEALARGIATELANEGFPRVPAQILLRLMVEPDGAMTAAALSASLELSPAAVSGGIRYLGVLGFVRIDVLPGTRRHVYSLPVLPWYASTLIQDRSGPLRTLIEAGLGDLEPGAAHDRLAEMADFFRFLQTELPRLWDRWQQSRP
ncbi:MAG: MarR family transcriptional regulator [Acidobacteria bacterium]|nr:MarR family transcriptional regulator [Acidobacteriota bacterium]